MINKLIIMVQIIFCLPLFSFGGVLTKSEMQKAAYSRIYSTLRLSNSVDATNQDIAKLATDLCLIYDYLPNENFNEKVGSWLIDSLVNMVILQANELLSNQDTSAGKIRNLHIFSKKLFSELDSKKGEELLERRNKLLAAEIIYSEKIFDYIVKRFSDAKIYKVVFDHDPDSQRLLRYVDKVKKVQSNKCFVSVVSCSSLDDFSRNLEYRIMTMVLMRDISIEFANYSEKNYMSIFSFYSRAYDESFFEKSGYPKDMDEVKESAEKLFNHLFPVHEGVLHVHLPSLSKFLSDLKRVRWGGEPIWNDYIPQSKRAITFQNDSKLWRMSEGKRGHRAKVSP